MKALTKRLNVSSPLFFGCAIHLECYQSPAVTGEINLTCDAWTVSNGDSYFAVTSHWIEEKEPGKWTQENALLGFVQMNTAHNGVCLGQAIFKICNRLKIMHKVCMIVNIESHISNN